MSLLKLLASSNYLSVNKSLIKIFGLEGAVILGELCSEYDYWQENDKLTDDGMFYCSVEKIEDNTGLSAYQQRTVIKTLESAGIITVTLKGLPATRYFKVNEEELERHLISRCEKTSPLDVKKLHSSNTQIDKNIEKEDIFLSNDKNISKKNPVSDNEINTFVNDYNIICQSLPRCFKVTDVRKRGISKILQKYSKDEILQVFNNLEASDFCTGRNNRGWKANIDFILREDKFVSVLEGKYGGRAKITAERMSVDRVTSMSPDEKERLRYNGQKF